MYERQRKTMIEVQIRSRGINNPKLLEIFGKIPRHLFVPRGYRVQAYNDCPLPIGHNQTISQPYIVALMTELLELKGSERVLEIGTGCGYQTAILRELVSFVYSIEIISELANKARVLLRDMGYSNIEIKSSDGYLGWQEYSPFDAIIVTCAPQSIPSCLLEQLAVGGRLVIPVGEHKQVLKLVRKLSAQDIRTKDIIPVAFVPMVKERRDDP